MANTTGTAGGVGSPQGGQQGWDDAENRQPIPPSSEGTTSAGITGTVYDPSKEAPVTGKAKTDAEKEREAQDAKAAEAGQAQSGETGTTYPTDLTPGDEVDPTNPDSQPNHGLPDGVTTNASRGESGVETPSEPEEQPNPTVEEQMAGGPEALKAQQEAEGEEQTEG